MSEPEPPQERIGRLLGEIGLAAERHGEREWGVPVPCQSRGAIAVGLAVGERTLTLRAFYLRGPDRAHREVYRRLLRKNLHTRLWRFALDADGDLFLVADLPLAGLDGPALDGLLGELSLLVDETYEGAVRTGFEVPEGTRFGPPPGAAES